MKSGRTIQAMAAEIRRQGEVKADYMVDTRCLRMEIWDGQPFLLALNESGHDLMEPMDIQTTAHRQLRAYLDIPIKIRSCWPTTSTAGSSVLILPSVCCGHWTVMRGRF